MTRLAIFAGALGVAALAALIVWSGADAVRADVAAAAWVLPALLAIHAVTLFLSAAAWRIALGGVPGAGRIFLLRLVREGVNSLLPLAHVGGNAVALRLLARGGVAFPTGLAGTTLDVTLEAAAQAVFTLAGIGVLASVRADAARAYLWGGGAITVATAALLAAFMLQGPRLVEAAAGRLAANVPGFPAASVAGLHAETRRLLSRACPLTAAFAAQVASWSLGTAETVVILSALGVPASLPAAFAIESLGQAARSAGFAVPGAVGVQEGGFVAACGLFGMAPETGLALSMLKRLRELAVGLAGLLAWRLA